MRTNRGRAARKTVVSGSTLLALFVGTALPLATGDESTLVHEDFSSTVDGALPSGWESPRSGFRVTDGALEGVAGNRLATVLFGDPTWRNVSVEAKVRFLKGGDATAWCALLVREAGATSPGIQLTARRATKRPDGLELAAKSGGNQRWRVFQTDAAPATFSGGDRHTLRIEAREHSIRAFFDGRLILRSPRADEISRHGRVGFRVARATVRIDDVTVRRLDAGDRRGPSGSRTRPLVIAHRGFSWVAPENTLVAYERAIATRVEMAECDVHLSADRVPVVIHDADLERTTGTKGKVSETTVEEIQKLDAGSWKDARFRGERIPTLRQLLERVKGRLRLVIEIKAKKIEREVVDAIQAAEVTPDAVMIFSFDRNTVKTIAQIEPLLPTTWLVGKLPPDDAGQRDVIRQALSARVNALGLPKDRVYPQFVRLAHECGFPVFVWTVNEIDDMRFLLRAGVDAIITDRPDLASRVVEPD